MRTVRLPGGLQISLSGLRGSEAYHRAMDAVGGATAPLKMVLDVLTLVLGIKRTLEAAPAIPGDPSEFVSRLRDITAPATRLLSALPQFSVPALTQDLAGALIELVQLVRDEVAAVQEIAAHKAEVETYVAVDPALEQVVVQIEAQQTEAEAGLAEMLEPLVLVCSIVDTFLELIGVSPLGITAEMTEDLAALDAMLEGIQDTLRRVA